MAPSKNSSSDLMEATLQRALFEKWARLNEFDLEKYQGTLDDSGMRAYFDTDTYMAWCGWWGCYKTKKEVILIPT